MKRAAGIALYIVGGYFVLGPALVAMKLLVSAPEGATGQEWAIWVSTLLVLVLVGMTTPFGPTVMA